MGLFALKAEGYNHIHYKPGGQIHFAPIFLSLQCTHQWVFLQQTSTGLLKQ